MCYRSGIKREIVCIHVNICIRIIYLAANKSAIYSMFYDISFFLHEIREYAIVNVHYTKYPLLKNEI